MRSRAAVRRHPIHPMLIVFPIAFWIGSFICDVIYHAGPGNLFWRDMAFYLMAGGILGALAAAIPGFIDYLALSNPIAKRTATAHMLLNIVVLVLFVFNLGVRLDSTPHTGLELALSIIGIGILAISGWLGGHMVYVGGVGVAAAEDAEKPRDRRAA